MSTAVLLAVDDARVNPGLLGFIVVALLGLATWLLLRSMIGHLRKVNFDDGDPRAHPGAESETAPGEKPPTPPRAAED